MSAYQDYFREVAQALAEIRADHAMLEARVERMQRKGKVTDVDPKKQLYRQEIGLDDDGNPVKSPWVPYAQFAGARVVHTPPAVGQQYLLLSPDGDHEQGHGIPLTFSQQTPSPSQKGDEHVDQFGKSKDTLKDGARKIEWDGGSLDLTQGKAVLTADTIVLVGKVKLGSEDASRELALRDSVDSAGDVEQDNLSTKVTAV